MTVVIADSSPLNYLTLIGSVVVLHQLYGDAVFRNTGTLGVLRAAALKDYVDLPTALARLLETNFRVSLELVTALLAEEAERRRRSE